MVPSPRNKIHSSTEYHNLSLDIEDKGEVVSCLVKYHAIKMNEGVEV
jgi:hypothetical protein